MYTIKLTLDEIKTTATEIKNDTSFKHSQTLNKISEYLINDSYNALKGIADKNSNKLEINISVIDKIKNKINDSNDDTLKLLEYLLELLLSKQSKKVLSTPNEMNIESIGFNMFTLKDRKILDTILYANSKKKLDIDFIIKEFNSSVIEENKLTTNKLSEVIQKFNKAAEQKNFGANFEVEKLSQNDLQEKLFKLVKFIEDNFNDKYYTKVKIPHKH